MTLIIYFIVLGTVSMVTADPFLHCSGQNTSTFPDINLQELAGEYYSYYLADTLPNVVPRLTDPVLTFLVPKNKGSNKFIAIGSGSNFNPSGGCLQALVQGYQIQDNRPCMALKLVEPVRCQDEPWLHWKISKDKLVIYNCIKFNVDGSCGHKVIRGMSTIKSLSPADKQAFKDAFARFGEPLPEIKDPLNNACQKIKRETQKFIEVNRMYV